MSHVNRTSVALLCSGALLLAACGGGGGSEAVPPATPEATVPPSASASISGMVDFLVSLVSGKSETNGPLDVSGFKPPTSETADPVAVK